MSQEGAASVSRCTLDGSGRRRRGRHGPRCVGRLGRRPRINWMLRRAGATGAGGAAGHRHRRGCSASRPPSGRGAGLFVEARTRRNAGRVSAPPRAPRRVPDRSFQAGCASGGIDAPVDHGDPPSGQKSPMHQRPLIHQLPRAALPRKEQMHRPPLASSRARTLWIRRCRHASPGGYLDAVVWFLDLADVSSGPHGARLRLPAPAVKAKSDRG